ncbi:hypothetical protein GURASL_10180 [Geotalea uraniireducens]|uniref:Zinc finger/thioredoxin putative domain-containing protein n=1 Tax=Geotalea uraniireducens TaxID=351604 RepID=A0ABM8EI39_9BACT|nr:DUF3426 domain-containing protein [Geotalea uraniireducens]BDV42095.1 hypothetical protein GURASL_10180 [Geotalea uraniireducens]
MIIQCAQCSSKFRLDDAKVTEAGIKVRCSKCKHIFVVKKETPAEEPDLDLLLQGLQPSGGGAGTVGHEPGALLPGPAEESAPSFSAVDEEGNHEEEQHEEGPFTEESAAAEVPAEPFSLSAGQDFPFAAPEESSFSAVEEPVGSDREISAADEFDFGSVAADESPADGEPFPQAAEASAEPAKQPMPDAGAEEFSFGDVTPEAFAAVTDTAPAENRPTPDLTFEFEAEETSEEVPSLVSNAVEDEPLDFGDIDFGIDEGEASQSGAKEEGPAETGPESAAAVPPPAEVPAGKDDEVPPVAVPFGDDELPPLTISSRRKGQSLVPAVVISVSVLIIVLLAGAGFYFVKEGPEALNKLGIGFVGGWLGMDNKEEGQIGLEKVRGCYFTNTEAGEVFVIRGEAINNFRKARASIQVKGALLGANAQILAQKVAFCGNNLTDEQIKSLPMVKIDAAMNNQFGDSLANLGVQPGKRIPFVIVLANIPKEAVDYSVEVVGSTVASQ